VDSARGRPRHGKHDRGGKRFAASRETLASRKPANDNRISLRGWIERAVALALLIGLAALLAWKVAG
jgi:hypothetical protein